MTNNKIVAAIALFLMMSMAFSLIALHVGNAQTYPSKKTYAYIIAQPNPVGVGQTVKLLIGITDYLYEYPDGWEGITVTVKDPDGHTETLGPYRTDPTGSTGATYVPDKVGTYTFQVHFPSQLYTWTAYNSRAPTLSGTIMYEASDSENYDLVVQEEALPGYPGAPLPTEYWDRPIDAQLREWTSIAGNWVSEPPQRYAPYNDGPEAPHILWAEPLVKGAMSPLGGGLVGGYTAETTGIDGVGFETGDAYEGLFTPRSSPVIMGGVLFFNRYNANGGTRVEKEVVAVDLHTGEELWVRNWDNRDLAFGQLFYWDSYNYHGTFAYLWSTVGSTWNCYEASTGRWVYSMSSVPSGTRLYGPKGEIIVYTVDLTHGWMTKWNSTHVVTETHIEAYGPTGSQHGSWIRMNEGTTLNGTLGIMWNVTIPTGLPGSVWTAYLDDKVIGNQIYGSGFHYMIGEDPIVYWAINLKDSQEGNLLYNVTWQKPQGDVAMWRVAYSAEDGVFVMQSKELRQLYGFDMDTGRKLWGPTDAMDYRSIYSYNGYIVDGKLYYVSQFAGTVYCYDVKTGDLLWTYYADDPYGASEEWQKEFGANEWPIEICFITDGKVYITHSEHSPNMPLPRGAPLICLDAETGEVIFRANGLLRQTRWGGRHLIGDSIMVGMDTYDQRVYAIGKGPSALTVSASPKISVQGSKILVEGIVADISPGTDDSTLQKRFPNGVPAVCDANMSDWMLYVYKQFAKPTDVMGVDVTISVLDPNGNYYDVATATSDDSGFYHVVFTPPVPGEYKIVAAFTGSKSYYGSHAVTAVNVEEAPAATAAPTPPPASMTDTYVLGLGAGAIIAIVAIGMLIILMFRKR